MEVNKGGYREGKNPELEGERGGRQCLGSWFARGATEREECVRAVIKLLCSVS